MHHHTAPITLLGAGRVATHLAQALHESGQTIQQVFSRTAASAEKVAAAVGARAVTDRQSVAETPTYIYCLKDDVLPEMAAHLAARYPHSLHIHTSGSTPLHIFPSEASHYGVLYPLQTFSRERAVDFYAIPCFVEASDEESLQRITLLAQQISHRVQAMDSERRRVLHLAAVFACNFVNHCYDIAATLLQEKAGLPFDTLLPLIDETAQKVHRLSPREAQTGPAVRYDQRIMEAHHALLADDALRRELYRALSDSIHQYAATPNPHHA